MNTVPKIDTSTAQPANGIDPAYGRNFYVGVRLEY